MFNVIDLFCGCGGLSEGFEEAGFKIILGTDVWQDAIDTYNVNFPNAKTITEDIVDVTSSQLLLKTGLSANNVDVIIGGPPCQGFSLSGKRLLNDSRNSLYKSFVRFVKEIQPKAFVMENVPGIATLFNGQVKEQVIKDFSEADYEVTVKELLASDYGVPQARRRIFFVGLNKKVFNNTKYQFPDSTHGENKIPYVTCKDALSDLDFIGDATILKEDDNYVLDPMTDYQRSMRRNAERLLNHVTTLHTENTKRIIALVPDGGNYKDLPENLRNTRKVHIAWTRMSSTKPCFTIDTGHNHHFHYRANRVPTVRESARIQSFPDTFKFTGNKTSQLRQVGNAVPPLLAKAIAMALKEVLEKQDV